MGDGASEPTMEEILSSIKRVIEESDAAPPSGPRVRRGRADAGGDVLELHERAPFPAAEATPRPAPPAPPAPEPQQAAQPAAAPSRRPESIVSQGAADASRGALDALSRMVVRPETPGSDTLEAMVREMLRPMLREWLDAQLPGIVEAMVAKEIARISGR